MAPQKGAEPSVAAPEAATNNNVPADKGEVIEKVSPIETTNKKKRDKSKHPLPTPELYKLVAGTTRVAKKKRTSKPERKHARQAMTDLPRKKTKKRVALNVSHPTKSDGTVSSASPQATSETEKLAEQMATVEVRTPPKAMSESDSDNDKVDMRLVLKQLTLIRKELKASADDTSKLRKEVEQLKRQLTPGTSSASSESGEASGSDERAPARLADKNARKRANKKQRKTAAAASNAEDDAEMNAAIEAAAAQAVAARGRRCQLTRLRRQPNRLDQSNSAAANPD